MSIYQWPLVNESNCTERIVIDTISKYIVSLFVPLCRVAPVCLDLRVLLEAVVLLVCLDREEREDSLVPQDLL